MLTKQGWPSKMRRTALVSQTLCGVPPTPVRPLIVPWVHSTLHRRHSPWILAERGPHALCPCWGRGKDGGFLMRWFGRSRVEKRCKCCPGTGSPHDGTVVLQQRNRRSMGAWHWLHWFHVCWMLKGLGSHEGVSPHSRQGNLVDLGLIHYSSQEQ